MNPIPNITRLRLYVAGPMSGVIDDNFPAFEDAAARLRAVGYSVINPAQDSGLPPGRPWADYMRADLPLLLQCHGVAYLLGAATPRQMQLSRGLRLERIVAEALDMPIHPVKWWIAKAAMDEASERMGTRYRTPRATQARLVQIGPTVRPVLPPRDV